MDTPLTKICTKCPEGDQARPLSAFYKDLSRADGLTPYCKQCIKNREANPERVAKRTAYKAAYHVAHADTINARSAQWQKDHPERVNARNKKSKRKRLLEQVAAGERAMPRKRRNRHESLLAGAKECSQCEAVKDLGEFYAWTKSPDGVQAECKDCHDGRNQPIYPRDTSILGKSCSQCGETKAATEFYDNPYVKSGIRADCKTCVEMRNNIWAHTNPEKRKQIANRYAKRVRSIAARRVIIYAKTRQWQLHHPEAVKRHGVTDRLKNGMKPQRRAGRRRTRLRFFASHPGYKRAAQQKRRALLKHATIVDTMIDVRVLHTRSHGICSLCGYNVDVTIKWPDLECATVEHRVPMSKGGAHAYSNTFLAHHYCNSLKHDQLIRPELLQWIRQLFALRFPSKAGPALTASRQLRLFD